MPAPLSRTAGRPTLVSRPSPSPIPSCTVFVSPARREIQDEIEGSSKAPSALAVGRRGLGAAPRLRRRRRAGNLGAAARADVAGADRPHEGRRLPREPLGDRREQDGRGRPRRAGADPRIAGGGRRRPRHGDAAVRRTAGRLPHRPERAAGRRHRDRLRASEPDGLRPLGGRPADVPPPTGLRGHPRHAPPVVGPTHRRRRGLPQRAEGQRHERRPAHQPLRLSRGGARAPQASARLGATAAIAAARSAAGGAEAGGSDDQAERVLFQTGRGTRPAWRTTTWVGRRRTDLAHRRRERTGALADEPHAIRRPRDGRRLRFLPRRERSERRGRRACGFVPGDRRNGAVGEQRARRRRRERQRPVDANEEIAASSGVDWNYPAVLDTTTAPQYCSPVYPCTWNATTPFSWQQNRNHFGTELYYLLNQFHDHLLAAPIGSPRPPATSSSRTRAGRGRAATRSRATPCWVRTPTTACRTSSTRTTRSWRRSRTGTRRSWACSCSRRRRAGPRPSRCTAATTPGSCTTSTRTAWSVG